LSTTPLHATHCMHAPTGYTTTPTTPTTHLKHSVLTQIERALKRAPLQERKQKKRQAAEQQDDEDEQQEQQHTSEQQQQQQQAGRTKGKKEPAAAAAAAAAGGDQPPSKRLKPSKHQQQQQQQQSDIQQQQGAPAGTAADKHVWLRTVALGVQNPGVYLQTAQQLAAGCGGLVDVLDPPPADVVGRAHLTQDGCSGHVVFLVYHDVSGAWGGGAGARAVCVLGVCVCVCDQVEIVWNIITKVMEHLCVGRRMGGLGLGLCGCGHTRHGKLLERCV